jgi:hypothetical protein
LVELALPMEALFAGDPFGRATGWRTNDMQLVGGDRDRFARIALRRGALALSLG